MRSFGRIVGTLIVIFLVVGVVAWQRYYPSSQMFQSLGLPGPRANTDRRCGGWYRQRSWGRTPTREVTCRPTGRQLGFLDRQEVELDRLTRQITSAHRTWQLPDSTAWATAQDSVGRVLDATGGRVMNCLPPIPVPTRILIVRAWHFPTYSVRFVAYHFLGARHPYGLTGPPEWLLQIDGYPGDPPDCGPHPRTRTK